MATNYGDNAKVLDVHKLRKKCAKATGMHGTFSKKNTKAQPNDDDRSHRSSNSHSHSSSDIEDEISMKQVCQETRLEDLQTRIPPLAVILGEMTANNDGATRGLAEELATELRSWAIQLEEAIDEYEIDSSECERSEEQLHTLGELRELVCDTLDAHHERPSVVVATSSPNRDESLIRFSSFSAAGAGSQLALPPAPVDPFESAFDPAKPPAPVDPFESTFDPFAESDATTQAHPVLDLFDRQNTASAAMDPFALPTQVQDPFASTVAGSAAWQQPAPQMQQQQHYMKMQQMEIQMQQMQAQQVQMKQMQQTQNVATAKKQAAKFDPFAPLQQNA